MDLSTVNHYIYEPLHHPRNIRLMILQPSDDPDSALEFLFSQEHISHFRGQYEALSYTWGEARFLHSVYHLGSEKSLLSITSNLHEALLRLRYSHKPRVLWVDAVCINQTDDVEKALQIPLMAHIFRGAYRVMAWLGPVESGSAAERGMNVLSNVSSRWTDPRDRQLGYEMGFDDFAALNPSTDFQTQMDSVGELLSLPWFSRLWIIQEVVVNPDVILICGSICISWTRLVAAFSNLQERGDTILSFHQTERIEPLKRIANLWFHHSMSRAGFLGMFGGPKPQNLFDMVESFWAYECRDARDRIYALYSLSSTTSVSASPEHAGITIDVDYRRSIRRVYQDFTIACLDSDEVDYRQVIKAAILRNDSFQSDDWPSWVPDWRIKPAGYANLPEIRGIHGPADPDRLLITLPTQWISVPGCELVQVTNVATAWIGVDAASQHGNFMSTLPSIIRILKSLGSMSEVTAYEILLQLLQGRHHDIRIGQHSLLHERLRSYLMDLWNEHLLPQKIQHLAEQYRDVIAELEPKTENIHFFTAQREHMGDVQTAFGLAGVMPKIGDEILAHSGGYDDLNQTISSAFVLRPGKNKAEDQNTVLRSYRLVGNATITLPFVDGQRTTYDDSPRPRYSSFYLE